MSDLMEALELATKKRRMTKKAALNKLGNKKAASSWYEYWGFRGGSGGGTGHGASSLGRGLGDQSHVVTNLAYAAGILGACYAAEKATGCVSTSLRTFSRQLEKVVANITDVPLFTPDGEEPETPPPRWSLPGTRLRHRLSRNGRESPSVVAATEDQERATVHQRRRISKIDENRDDDDDDEDNDDKGSNSSFSRAVTDDSSSTLGGHSALGTDLSTSGSDVVAHALADRSTRSLKSNGTAGTESTNNDSLPHFFSSTKLLACLDLEESRALFESARIVRLAPEETLFHSGDPSNGGTYIVVEGSLGVFQTDGPVTGGAPDNSGAANPHHTEWQWSDTESDNLKPMHTNTLQEGESVGDLDVVDGNRRTVTCVALEEGAVLVEISRELFMDFVLEKPRALQVYLQQAIARLWRVAHFVLNDTLSIPQSKRKHELFDLVPSKEVGLLDGELLSLLLEKQVGHHVCLPTGVSLYEEGTPADAFYILLKGKMLIEKTSKGEAGGVTQCTADIVSPHCIIGSTAYFTSTVRRQSVRALEFSELVAIGVVELEKLRITSSKAFVSLLVTAAKAMGPLIRKFISLGLNRVWLHAHDIPFRQGDPSSSIYITISGRMILAHQDETTGKVQTEEIAGRGEAIGAVWSLAEGQHEKTAMCTRDSELVRMSRGAFQCISNKYPAAAVRLLEGMAQRMAGASNPAKGGKKLGPGFQVHGGGGQKKRVATVALIPLEGQTKLCDAMASELKEALEKLGPTLLLSGGKVGMAFPVVAERLSNRFYRSKLTAWMAAQEEDYTYILLQADSEVTEWSKICVAQADCVLLLSSGKENPQVSAFEHNLVWRHVNRTQMNLTEVALRAFRVELLLVHQDRQPPTETSAWLRERPGLERHHHMVREDLKDMERLARWLSGKAVGLVLSGGGSRGLAHLGVLRALDDAGVPIDIVGGTSQGAFMAALFAQRLPWDRMFNCVQDYAAGLGSFRSVMKDLTLPILSLFAGTGFTALVAQCLKYGPHNIEDLWLRFFCVSTNLSKGEPSVHESGPLSTLVRASMSVVGLLPPVFYENDLLVDGGYLNNIPVDVMRTQMGVDTLIVVDVEDKDFCTWKDLAPYESGLSGFFLLWESIRSCVSRKPFRYPRYGEMINSLMFLSHQQQIRATMRDFHVDLYMQPTGVQFYRLMDYHLMDRIVRDAYRYGWTKVAEWTASTCHTEGDSSSAMKLRTRRLSKAHSLDFVRSIRPARHPHQESSVERIRNQLLQRVITGTGVEEGKRVAGSAADDHASPATTAGERGRQGDLGGNGLGMGPGQGRNGQNGDGLGDGCGEPTLVKEDFYPVPSALKRKVKSCAVLI